MPGQAPKDEPLLTPAEVAAMFRVDSKTVARWAKAGKLTSTRTLGNHRRYREREVRALLERGEPDPLDAALITLWPGTAAGPKAVARKKLAAAGVATVGQLAAQSAEDLAALGIRGPALDEVRLALAKRGLALHGEVLGKVALRPRPGSGATGTRDLPLAAAGLGGQRQG